MHLARRLLVPLPAVWLLLAVCASSSAGAAKQPYQKCIEQDPNFADCYCQLGNIFLWTDDEQKALENYTEAIKRNPKPIWYYTSLADLYIRLGYMKEAEQVFE